MYLRRKQSLSAQPKADQEVQVSQERTFDEITQRCLEIYAGNVCGHAFNG